jgi:hypothetical protein
MASKDFPLSSVFKFDVFFIDDELLLYDHPGKMPEIPVPYLLDKFYCLASWSAIPDYQLFALHESNNLNYNK